MESCEAISPSPIEKAGQKPQVRIKSSSGDLQDFDNGNNDNSQGASLSPSNNQAITSFLPDMPSIHEVPQIQDTLNLSNDLSKDLIELGADEQFQNAFNKQDDRNDRHGGLDSKNMHQIGSKDSIVFPSGGINNNDNISPHIMIRDDDFLKFDDNEGKNGEDSLPLSGSLAFGGEQPGNLSNILESSNPFSKRTTNQEIDKFTKDVANGSSHQRMQKLSSNDMFKPQDKLFLNDMSNIVHAEDLMTQKSLDPANTNQNSTILGSILPTSGGPGGVDPQLQQTLILDAEEDKREMQRRSASRQRKDNLIMKHKQDSGASSHEDDDTIAGLAMLGADSSSIGKQVEPRIVGFGNGSGVITGEDDRMISFDASRISPSHGGNLDTSHALMNNTVGQLEKNLGASWPKDRIINESHELQTSERKDDGMLKDELNKEEVKFTRPQKVTTGNSAGTNLENFGQEVHSGSLFGRNHKKLAMPSRDQVRLEMAGGQRGLLNLDSNINHDEILTQSLTNTFSTIQSLHGELNAIRNNLELNQKIQSNQKGARHNRVVAIDSQPAQEESKRPSKKSQDRKNTAPVSGS